MRRERRPPGIATWLLKGLGCSADNDAVIGDLTEEFLRGRTSVWFWKQTAVAILAGAFQDLRRHKFRAMAAIAGGCTAMGFVELFLARLLTSTILPDLATWILPEGWWNSEGFGVFYSIAMGALTSFLTASGGSWIAFRLYYRRQSIVLAFGLLLGLLMPINYVFLYLHNEPLELQFTFNYFVAFVAAIGGVAAGGLRKQTSVQTESV
jgi:hypothetical protein